MNTVYRDSYMNTNMSQEKSSTVFISYSWAEKECGCDWVVGLANKLRSDGIDADIDMYHESPAEGWTTWIINKIKQSDYVLVVCSESYYNVVNGGQTIDSGLGRRFEGKIIQKQIYDSGCINDKFIPILPPNGSRKHILEVLSDYTAYKVYDDYEKLIKRLKGENNHMPPLGQKKIKTMFTGLIDPILWSEAKWLGMSFVIDRKLFEMPIVGFVFDNPKGAQKAFEHIISNIGKDDALQQLGISFVSNKDNTGYYTHIYPMHQNITSKIERSGNVHIATSITLSRVRENVSQDGIQNIEALKNNYQIFNACYVEPAIIVDGKLQVAEKLRFVCRNVKFRKYSDITTDDIDVAIRPELAHISQ